MYCSHDWFETQVDVYPSLWVWCFLASSVTRVVAACVGLAILRFRSYVVVT